MYSLSVLDARNLKSRCQLAMFPLEGLEENPLPLPSLWWLPLTVSAFLGLSLCHSNLCLCCHMAFSPLCLCLNFPGLRTAVIGGLP